jgi:hypothetical protein
MSAFSELQTEVLSHGFNTSTYGTLVLRWLNMANRKIARRLGVLTLQKETTIALVAGTADYALASDAVRPTAIWNETAEDELEAVELDQYDRFDDTQRGTPTHYAMAPPATAGGVWRIRLWPIPDGGLATLAVRYESDPADGALGDFPWVPAAYEDALVAYALCRAYAMEDDPQMATYWRTEFERGMAEIGTDRHLTRNDRPKQVRGMWHPMESRDLLT